MFTAVRKIPSCFFYFFPAERLTTVNKQFRSGGRGRVFEMTVWTDKRDALINLMRP